MDEGRKSTIDEVAEIRRRRPEMRASLAYEGLVPTAEEETLFDLMEERLGPAERTERILAFDRAGRGRSEATR